MWNRALLACHIQICKKIIQGCPIYDPVYLENSPEENIESISKHQIYQRSDCDIHLQPSKLRLQSPYSARSVQMLVSSQWCQLPQPTLGLLRYRCWLHLACLSCLFGLFYCKEYKSSGKEGFSDLFPEVRLERCITRVWRNLNMITFSDNNGRYFLSW